MLRIIFCTSLILSEHSKPLYNINETCNFQRKQKHGKICWMRWFFREPCQLFAVKVIQIISIMGWVPSRRHSINIYKGIVSAPRKLDFLVDFKPKQVEGDRKTSCAIPQHCHRSLYLKHLTWLFPLHNEMAQKHCLLLYVLIVILSFCPQCGMVFENNILSCSGRSGTMTFN